MKCHRDKKTPPQARYPRIFLGKDFTYCLNIIAYFSFVSRREIFTKVLSAFENLLAIEVYIYWEIAELLQDEQSGNT